MCNFTLETRSEYQNDGLSHHPPHPGDEIVRPTALGFGAQCSVPGEPTGSLAPQP